MKVDNINPVSFEEFLELSGASLALDAYREVPFPNFRYDTLLSQFHLYCLIGGLPEVVKKFAETHHINMLSDLYENRLAQLFEKAAKGASTEKTRNRTLQIYQDAYMFAGTRITFSGFSHPRFRSRDVAQTMHRLEGQVLLRLIHPTTSVTFPLTIDRSRHPRIQLPDTGLVNYFSGIQEALAGQSDLSSIFNRQISLHITAQELLAGETGSGEGISFWVREKTQSSAEVDFIIPFEGKLIPVELKKGEPGRLRSVHQFIERAPHPFAVQLHAGPLQVRETRTISGKTFYLLTLPYFLAGKIREHLSGFIRFVES